MFVCLFLCRLKQTTQPAEGVDYDFLQPLYNTVEELFITGTPVLSQVFMHFNKLNTLSLGEFCSYVSTCVEDRKPLLRLR